VWPEAIITYGYAEWGDTLGRLSLAARRPAQRARGYAAMPSRRVRVARRRRQPVAGRAARAASPQARRAAAGTSTHLRCDQASGRGLAFALPPRPLSSIVFRVRLSS